jgi:hypothetical protein
MNRLLYLCTCTRLPLPSALCALHYQSAYCSLRAVKKAKVNAANDGIAAQDLSLNDEENTATPDKVIQPNSKNLRFRQAVIRLAASLPEL